MSLGLVVITSLTFMLSNANGTNSIQQSKDDIIISQVPDNNELGEEKLIETQRHDLQTENANEFIIEENKREETEEEKIENTSQDLKVQQIKDEAKSPVQTNTKSQDTREDRYLNKQTENTNILCLGIAEKELEMISIYSINKNNKKSAGIFLPTRTSVTVNGEMLSLREIYRQYGILNLKKILSQCLVVDIPYHMVADKQGLVELSELIGPLYVENENIDIPNLFVRPVSGKDDEILQSLAEKVTQPKMFLQVPKLIKIFIANVQSDIGVSGLWDLYSVFKNLNHSELSKTVLWGEKMHLSNKDYWFIAPYNWHNVVYEMTK